jgi:endonuclease-3 related protein
LAAGRSIRLDADRAMTDEDEHDNDNDNDNEHLELRMYEALLAAYGPQHWWPADSPTEVVIGAILTQNTAWSNVEKAIAAMKAAGCLNFCRIHRMPVEELAVVIRSAGTYRVKAQRLKAFTSWLFGAHDGDLDRALRGKLAVVRRELLAIPGIGPETADAILLYAGGRRSFVVDAYTKRLWRRHRLIEAPATYDAIKSRLEAALPRDARLYNEYHALIVELGKRHCRTRPNCRGCPLERWPHDETE